MQTELKAKLLKFLQKIIDSVPGTDLKTIEPEAFLLEMQVRMSNRNLTLETPKEIFPLINGMTESQAEHFHTIRWLIDPMGPRAIGKTHLMAVAFIQHSLYYGVWVNVFNHSANPVETKEMLERIQMIVGNIKELRLSIKSPMSGTPKIKVARIQEDPVRYIGEWKDA
ncbi:MAG: hypothetical protein GY797_38970 [Deltaproteobacteria bacterium]|nr:hypothetical protein [Deltaproteobacteria bacterium]